MNALYISPYILIGMETRTNWWVLVAACGVAVLLIGAAIVNSLSDDDKTMSGRFSVGAPTDNVRNVTQDAGWRDAVGAITAASAGGPIYVGEYRAPPELPTTRAISNEISATYIKQKTEGTLGTEAGDQELRELVERNVRAIEPKDTYTLASVPTGQVSLETYLGRLMSATDVANGITEYEMVTFAEAVKLEDYNGTPELAAVANLYRTMEKDLVALTVPPALAQAHLEVVKSTAFLAQCVELMAEWSGDPVDALTYIDGFTRAERRVRTALDALFATIVKIDKQS